MYGERFPDFAVLFEWQKAGITLKSAAVGILSLLQIIVKDDAASSRDAVRLRCGSQLGTTTFRI
jgi:hypothetical protein